MIVDVRGEEVNVKKDAHKAMCRNSTEKNKRRHKCMKNKAKKAVSKAMREKAEELLTESKNCPNGVVEGSKLENIEIDGAWCMKGKQSITTTFTSSPYQIITVIITLLDVTDYYSEQGQ